MTRTSDTPTHVMDLNGPFFVIASADGATRLVESFVGAGAFDAQGRWTRGKLRGYVYLLRNTGTTAKPAYAAPVRLQAGGQDIDPYGMPSPSWGDFDGDGDLDLL